MSRCRTSNTQRCNAAFFSFLRYKAKILLKIFNLCYLQKKKGIAEVRKKILTQILLQGTNKFKLHTWILNYKSSSNTNLIILNLNSHNHKIKGFKQVNNKQILKKIYCKRSKLNIYENFSVSWPNWFKIISQLR